MRSDFYQIVLIFLGVIVTALFAVFFYHELFPEYRIYQNDYVALEEFRSTYIGEPPPPFQFGIKQIVIEKEDKGPPVIDRCISCHVAENLPDFSPTKISYDLNGNLMLDEKGFPLQVPNENYVWAKLDEKIAELPSAQAEKLKRLKTAKVGDYEYDVTKVLRMHPLIGRETRPFEYHPMEEYGCTSCHGGNGRGLTTDKAHGPVFDQFYESEDVGIKPLFLEVDLKNDPEFSRVFNSKPGHELLFQTTPILVGALKQAKCIQCHQSSSSAITETVNGVQILPKWRDKQIQSIHKSLEREKAELLSLLELKKKIKDEGFDKTLETLNNESQNYTLPPKVLDQIDSQIKFLKKLKEKKSQQSAIVRSLNKQIMGILGSPGLAKAIESQLKEKNNQEAVLDQFLKAHLDDPKATGTLFVKMARVNLEEAIQQHVKNTEASFTNTVNNQQVISEIKSDVDYLTQGYHNGENLFLSQACYACHRISGFSRGGIGPELTKSGEGYPWFIKESIVWPQADLKTSTMPNYHLDHEELEALVTYLLGQRGGDQTQSKTERKIAIQEWEAGKKLPWEKPITPVQMKDLRYAMTVFATEGCAACHRLEGFKSNVGFSIEKGKKTSFEELYQEKQWFERLFPEEVKGSDIVKAIDENAQEIDKRIVDDVRSDSILEEIEKKHPGTIEAYYSNFKYAIRAKNYAYAKDKKFKELEEWKKRIHRILMMYIQQYGLGRLIGPRPNWSGIYRSDEWLMEHFKNPSSLVPRSIMPVLPFDDTKFYALTNMLDVLAIENRNQVHQIWKTFGFDPQLAVKIHCAQCHGEFLQGHGPVAEWIYPIPKNLRNAQFLRNLTKERVLQSILHGVKGTPMPPWGEVATDKTTADGIAVFTHSEAAQIVDWLFASLPGGRVIRSEEEVPKWQYEPEDAIEELKKEGNLETFENSYQASKQPVIAETKVTDIFNVVPNPLSDGNDKDYYIKKTFYTPENLWQGQHFFELNCAVCHGKEGEGSGQRAAYLQEAKPRMLTNLNWLESRDDLRLLRSIKYGVSGTAMTPWGDLTSSLQRMQLVMYIRTLSADSERRNLLFNALFEAFNRSDRLIEEARVQEYHQLEHVQDLYQETKNKREKINRDIQAGLTAPNNAGAIYQQEMSLLEKLKQYQEADQLLNSLRDEVKKEREIYQNLGVTLINKLPNDQVLQALLKLIRLNDNRYSLKDNQLQIKPVNVEKMSAISNQLTQEIDQNLSMLEEKKKKLTGKIISSTRDLELKQLNTEITVYKSLKNNITSSVEQALRSQQQQQKILQEYQKKQSQLE